MQEELLIERVLSGSSEASDWEELEARAKRDPGLWRRLALCLRDGNLLADAVEEAAARADALEWNLSPAPRQRVRRRRWTAGLGWAAAAVLALLWLAPTPSPRGLENGGGADHPQPGAVASSDAAWRLYREAAAREGRLVEELPLVMVDQRPLPDGAGAEVTYLRRIVERRRVEKLLVPASDEWGDAVAVQARPASFRRDRL